MEQGQIEVIRAALERERESLGRQLGDLGAPVDSADVEMGVDEGFADSGQATAERSQALTLIEQLHATYEEVKAALTRLEQGTFGKCENCGRDIPPERLEALPTARLCVTCKQAGGSSRA
jgi:RNA polymerase-binding protein DksA